MLVLIQTSLYYCIPNAPAGDIRLIKSYYKDKVNRILKYIIYQDRVDFSDCTIVMQLSYISSRFNDKYDITIKALFNTVINVEPFD